LLSITGGSLGSYRNRAEQRLGRLRAELDYANIREIIAGGIHEFIDRFQTKLNDVGDAIFETFLASQPVGDPANVPSRQVQHQASRTTNSA
jgi:uncharacterized alpha-E superfamily protein